MRLLINENIPQANVTALRDAGHDVASVAELAPRISDTKVMTIAHEEQRVVVTFDRDYGALVFGQKLPMPGGVLYLRFQPVFPTEPAEYLIRLIEAGIELEGKFTTSTRKKMRQRSLLYT